MTLSRKKQLAFAAILGVVGAVMAGVAGAAKSKEALTPAQICSQKQNQNGTLKLGHSFIIPPQWNPLIAPQGSGQILYFRLMYDTLTRIDTSGNAQPELATSWKYQSGPLRLTFTIRSGQKFTDGTPVNATTVAQSFTYALTSPTSLVKGDLVNVAKVYANGPNQVVFLLHKRDYQLPLLLAGTTGTIVSPTALANPTSLQTHSGGSGPFKIDSVQEGGIVTLVRNPGFWNAKNVHLAKIILNFINDESARVSAMRSGQLDIGSFLGTSAPVLRQAGLKVIATPSLNFRDLNVKTDAPPFNDGRVIDAINYALDRKAIVSVIEGSEFAAPAFQPFPKGYVAYNAALANLYPYNPTKAKQLLAQAGYQNGFDTKLGALQTLAYPQMAEVIQAQLAKVGIRTTIYPIPFASIGPETRVKHLHTLWGDGFPGLPSPLATFAGIWGTNGPWNANGPGAPYPRPLANAVAAAAAAPTSAKKYPSLLQKVVAAGTDLGHPIFLYTVKIPVGYNKHVVNFTPNPVQFQLDGVCMVK